LLLLRFGIEPLQDTLHQLRVPCAATRCVHLALVQLGGNAAYRIVALLQFTNDGRDLLGARLRLRAVFRCQCFSSVDAKPYTTPLRSGQRRREPGTTAERREIGC
jgi:hypothetical protein